MGTMHNALARRSFQCVATVRAAIIWNLCFTDMLSDGGCLAQLGGSLEI
jgi:hypothetical protein